jgi:hypothetical protein
MVFDSDKQINEGNRSNTRYPRGAASISVRRRQTFQIERTVRFNIGVRSGVTEDSHYFSREEMIRLHALWARKFAFLTVCDADRPYVRTSTDRLRLPFDLAPGHLSRLRINFHSSIIGTYTYLTLVTTLSDFNRPFDRLAPSTSSTYRSHPSQRLRFASIQLRTTIPLCFDLFQAWIDTFRLRSCLCYDYFTSHHFYLPHSSISRCVAFIFSSLPHRAPPITLTSC